MDAITMLRALGSLLIVLGLMAGMVVLLRRHGHRLQNFGIAPAGAASRLKVIESRAIDARTRLVLVQRDEKEYLLLLTPAGATVVEASIEKAKG
jgi:flagellar biogenesis protein FliO